MKNYNIIYQGNSAISFETHPEYSYPVVIKKPSKRRPSRRSLRLLEKEYQMTRSLDAVEGDLPTKPRVQTTASRTVFLPKWILILLIALIAYVSGYVSSKTFAEKQAMTGAKTVRIDQTVQEMGRAKTLEDWRTQQCRFNLRDACQYASRPHEETRYKRPTHR